MSTVVRYSSLCLSPFFRQVDLASKWGMLDLEGYDVMDCRDAQPSNNVTVNDMTVWILLELRASAAQSEYMEDLLMRDADLSPWHNERIRTWGAGSVYKGMMSNDQKDWWNNIVIPSKGPSSDQLAYDWRFNLLKILYESRWTSHAKIL